MFNRIPATLKHIISAAFIIPTAFQLLCSCSATRVIPEGKSMLRSNTIVTDANTASEVSDLQKYIKQSPNNMLFGVNPFISLYNTGDGSGKGWDKFAKKVGQEPVIFEKKLVESSKSNMNSHLKFKGFYGSVITDSIKTKNKKTRVTYYVLPGKRYVIDSVSYNIKDDALREIIASDTASSLVKKGKVMSEDLLENESERLAAKIRNRGYYGFTKNYFFFRADTMMHNGFAHIDVAVENFTRNETAKESRPHKVYTFGDIYVTPVRNYSGRTRIPKRMLDSLSGGKADSLRNVFLSRTDTSKYRNIYVVKRGRNYLVRRSVLDKMNLIKPGNLYSDDAIEATYQRFSSMGLFSSVNVQLAEIDSSKVKTDIRLMANTMQGYKLNLQGSTNSNGLFGISPAISYYHKNLFRGAEVLSISLMGDFQFKPNSNVHSTELGVSSSLTFPTFLLLPDRWFSSGNVPHTELTASYNYQKRPEYTRNIISASYGYTWTVRNKWFFRVKPIQANIIKLYNLDSTFYKNLNDPFLRNSYKDHFDIGAGGSVYYTTDASSNPAHSYFYFRWQLDLSGNIISLFNSALQKNAEGERQIWNSPYSQYYKTEFQGVYTLKFGQNPSHMLAVRFLGGIGKGYGNSNAMPFEKLFWGGGAYDMRGWQPRTLGPGYSQLDTAFTISNQTGDIKLEGNIEYRFPMFWILKGAVFADAGNIWMYDRGTDKATGKKTAHESIFRFKDFYRHIALDWGLGLRMDLNFALLRLDLGFKTFNPASSSWIGPDKWFKNNNFEFSFGIGYPF